MPTELDQLAHDVPYLADLARSDPAVLAAAANTPDPLRHASLIVLNDLFWQVQQYAAAICALVPHDLHLPVQVVLRGLYESAATMGYLRTHPAKDREGAILLAYTYWRDTEELSDDQAATRERRDILSRMPPDIVAEAKRRGSTRPKGWSGLTVKDLAAKSGVKGYDVLYGPLSGSSHAARAGRYFRLIAVQDGRVEVRTGWPSSPEERETQANFARRILHSAFKIMWEENGGGPVHFKTTNPEDWLRTHRAS
ncbi:MAG: DUF5677 domain-containing protein [Gemmatimonadales bacterium]